MTKPVFCRCGERVANAARDGGLVIQKALYDPETGELRALCKCKREVPIKKSRSAERLVFVAKE